MWPFRNLRFLLFGRYFLSTIHAQRQKAKGQRPLNRIKWKGKRTKHRNKRIKIINGIWNSVCKFCLIVHTQNHENMQISLLVRFFEKCECDKCELLYCLISEVRISFGMRCRVKVFHFLFLSDWAMERENSFYFSIKSNMNENEIK